MRHCSGVAGDILISNTYFCKSLHSPLENRPPTRDRIVYVIDEQTGWKSAELVIVFQRETVFFPLCDVCLRVAWCLVESSVRWMQKISRAIQIDFGTIQIDFGAIQIDFGAIQIDFGAIQIDFGTIQIDFGAIQIDFWAIRIRIAD